MAFKLPDPEKDKFKPNYFSPDNAPSDPNRLGVLSNATGFINMGDRSMVISPTATTTNFPTSRDAVNQSVQRALTVRAAAQPPAAPAASPFLTDRQNAVDQSKKWQEEQLMAGKDRNKWTVEWRSHGLGETPVVRKLTPQEQQAQWEDMNTLASADMTGKSGMVPPVNVFAGNNHLDTPLLTQSRKDLNPTVWANYRHLTRQADEKLNQALAARASVPHSVEEAQEFIDSLGFDDRVGEHVERSMTRYLQNANPELYKKIIGQKEVQKADDASYIQWVRLYSDQPGVAKLDPEEILAQRTPDSQLAFERDPRAIRHGIDPATGKVVALPPRVLSPEETAQEKFRQDQQQRALQDQQIDQIVAQSGGRMVKTYKPDGAPAAMPIEQYQREQEKLERSNTMEDVLASREMREQAAEERRRAADTPEEKRRQKLEDMAINRRNRLEEIAYKNYTKATELDDPKAEEKFNAEMERIKKLVPLPEDATPAPAAPAQPAATAPAEPTATNPQTGQKMVFRNGKWIPI